jgi:hypothetical protein
MAMQDPPPLAPGDWVRVVKPASSWLKGKVGQVVEIAGPEQLCREVDAQGKPVKSYAAFLRFRRVDLPEMKDHWPRFQYEWALTWSYHRVEELTRVAGPVTVNPRPAPRR